MSEKGLFHLSSSPHFTSKWNTHKIMGLVLISLLPETIYGIYLFGVPALLTILVSVATCVLTEFVFQKATKQKVTVSNLSAAVTGLLLALVCPATVPFWTVMIADVVAIVIAKGLFGGIGSNVFNPALTGRAFLFISFPAVMGATWAAPHQIDAVSSATILSALKNGSATGIDYLQYFIGDRAGCIGETSILLILISFIFLLGFKIIDWRAPAGMVGTVVVASAIVGLTKDFTVTAVYTEILNNLLTGGLLFGAAFMITDYATTPVTKPGRLIFGIGCGLITFLIRKFGGYPEGVMFSILIMNAVAPFLNNLTTRMYGYGKKGVRKANHAKIAREFDLHEKSKI